METTMIAVLVLVIGLIVLGINYTKNKEERASKKEAWRLSPLNKNGPNFDQAEYDRNLLILKNRINK